LFGCDVICRRIKEVNYADWETMDQWLPSKYKSGFVHFEPIVPDRINEVRYAKFVDIESKIVFAIRQPVFDKKDNPQLRRFSIRGPEKINLADKTKRIEALILMHQPFVKNGPLSSNEDCFVKMENIEEKAASNRKRRAKFAMALEIIEDLGGAELKNFARLLIPVDQMASDDIIKNELEEFSYQYPDKFLAEWRNTDRSIRELLERAKVFGTIIFRHDLGWTYNDNPLGFNDLEVINTLRSSPIHMSSISKATLESEKVSLRNNNVVLDQEAENALEKIAKVPQGDRSVTDTMVQQAIQQQAPAIDISQHIDKLREQIKKELMEEMNVEKKEKEVKFQEEIFEEEAEAEQLEKKIEEEIHNLEMNLFLGKDLSDWKYTELKNWCAENVPKSEYGSVINKDKETLFNFLISWNKEQLEKGIIIPHDSTGND
jgi:hypothetical protein